MNRVLLIFIDGIGIGKPDPAINPFLHPDLQYLNQLLYRSSKALDAQLGIPGLPQSATGQTTLLTGINAARKLGTHREGFPNHQLKEIIKKYNIFKQLSDRGLKATFANAYYRENRAEIKYQSVTTVATFSTFGQVRNLNDLKNNRAVFQDITNQYLTGLGMEVPVITPEKAGFNLACLSRDYHLTLFEYFKTDRAGHSRDRLATLGILGELQAFLKTVVDQTDMTETLILITSDHGNVEDLSVKTHTPHPVPLVARGWMSREVLERAHTITDICPVLVQLLTD